MRRTLVVCAVLAATVAVAADWHHPLYIGNGGIWRQRIAVQVRNGGEAAAPGEPVELKIGAGAGQIALAGATVDSLRVCDEAGVEVLYAVQDAQGELVERGPVPAGGSLFFATDVPPQGQATYYVYFDNPAAWAVPDFAAARGGVRNGGVELGEGDTPAGWSHDTPDEQHRASWVTEHPYSGQRCLKTVVAAGAPSTWIATRQRELRIVPGAKYVLTAWVKAQDVVGNAGWYIHVGNSSKPMMMGPVLSGGQGTFDWKQVRLEFTAPPEANLADLGTVLYGTGTAWFDDVALETEARPTLTAAAGKAERLPLQEIDERPGAGDWVARAPIRVMNWQAQARQVLVATDAGGLVSRLQSDPATATCRIMRGDRELPYSRLGETVVFRAELPPQSITTYTLLLGGKSAGKLVDAGYEYEALLNSPLNLARNGNFEQGDTLPDGWPGGAEGEKPAGATLGFDEPGLFGKRCVKISVPHDAKPAWTGWRQDVPVEPGKTYLYSAWLKCEDLKGSLQLHAHKLTEKGELSKDNPYTGAGPAISGTTNWTQIAAMFTMPADCTVFQLHLTMNATGTAWHDGALLMEAERGEIGPVEGRPAKGLEVWPVPAVVKVFRHDVQPDGAMAGGAINRAATVALARNEYEPLQLALRSDKRLEQVRVVASAPVGPGGKTLPAPQVNVVGYVPIDHAGGYYSSKLEDWQRRMPSGTGGSDGFAGMWPDPLLPDKACDVAPNQTQAVWVTFHAPTEAAPGQYSGTVKLVQGDKVLWQRQVGVQVRKFALPAAGHLAAIYDTRQYGGSWGVAGRAPQQTREDFWKFMADRRVCPDQVRPEPRLTYKDGQVTADFTEYDKAAAYYFDVLKMPHSYTPGIFYCFGWGHPPYVKFGEQPYEGEWPFEGVDRSKLRPEYKRAYQAVLKAYWEHVKARGWADRIVLYMSDEPYDSQPEIRTQMKALCDMVHEVDPAIRIYVSNWREQPEWEGGTVNVWGAGHYGCFSVEKMKKLQADGDTIWWTTDGQMCTDTPYCGVERLLPHYAFKYGAKAYEFWGMDWLTYDPYEFGWHRFIKQSGTPGKIDCVRYPCGDGFLAYPGKPIGHDGPVSSVRLEQAREGMEDYEYLWLLQDLVAKAKGGLEARTTGVKAGEAALAEAARLVEIPSAGGRYSTKILPDPQAVYRVREQCARAIEGLMR